jgi:hypothetical protein
MRCESNAIDKGGMTASPMSRIQLGLLHCVGVFRTGVWSRSSLMQEKGNLA